MTEIIIEGVKADVYDSIEAKFTYQIDDIKSFGTRNTSFSKTIKLPATPRNKALFGFIERTDIANNYNSSQTNIGDNFNPAVAAKCVILCDYVQVFKGVIRVLEVVTIDDLTEYECSVFGELGGFMSAISNKYLTDLDFSAYDAAWNWTNISGSWNSIAGSGVYFGLGDYGNCSVVGSNKKDWYYKAFRPSLYLKEYLEKIATASGYTVDIDDLTALTPFNKMVIPHNEDYVYILGDILGVLTSKTHSYSISTYPYNISFPLDYTAYTFTHDAGYQNFTYSAVKTCSIGINLSLTFTYNCASDFTLSVKILKNAVAVYTESKYLGADSSGAWGFNIFDVFTSITTGDVIAFEFSYSGISVPTITFGAVPFQGNVHIREIAQVSIKAVYNDTLNINNCIPKNIKQTDFFTSILKMFNCYVIEDKNIEKKIKITPYPDFYYPLATANDLTNKVDRAKEIRIKPMSELNARFFNYLYDVDSDYINEIYKKKYGIGYGEYLLDTNYEFSKEKSECKVIFSGSPLFSVTGEKKQWSVFFKSSDNGTTEAEQSTKIRLLIAKKITGLGTNWTMYNGATDLSGSINYYGYMGHLDNPTTPTYDLNWNIPKELYYSLSNPYPSTNLFSSYWQQYMTEIINKDSKLMTCNVWLTKEEIQGLDFSKPIYIDGSLFKLNKVLDYDMNTNETTKVELLKII